MLDSGAPDPCVLVIFGASGDLTRRKLIPSLFDLHQRGELPERVCILGVSRSAMSDDDFRAHLRTGAEEFATAFNADAWTSFASRVCYHAADATKTEAGPGLCERVRELGGQYGLVNDLQECNVLFYLAVAPSLYDPIIETLGQGDLITEGRRWCAVNPEAKAWQRIIVEKPFGEDLDSAMALNQSLGRVFEEDSIYRIDHYLGKELIQNLFVMRFANAIFEPLWNRNFIDHVQVTATESIGVGARAGSFYDNAGAIRDMIQSHLLQVLALVAMEPPSRYEAAAIMREKIQLVNAARPVQHAKIPQQAVLGRYGSDTRTGEPAYAETEGVDAARRTETYGAMRVDFDTWRWAGVPFYLRSGKKLARKATEVMIVFKRPPTNLFRDRIPEALDPNRLIISVAPSEGIGLRLLGKVPGRSSLQLAPAVLDLDYIESFGSDPIDAYGPLLLDAMRGDRTLFKHRDEVEGGWRICQPFLDNDELRQRIETYEPGSWGPEGADVLLARDGRAWRNT